MSTVFATNDEAVKCCFRIFLMMRKIVNCMNNYNYVLLTLRQFIAGYVKVKNRESRT